MAAPLVTAIPNAVGRIIYRKGGQFINRNTYLREIRRVGGKFGSARSHAQKLSQTQIADTLQNIFGSPIDGGNWRAKVRASEDRFTDYLGDL